MHNLKPKLKKLFSSSFEDEKMETQYYSIKMQNAHSDFKGAALFMIVLNILGLIAHVEIKNWPAVGLLIGSMLSTVALLLSQRFVKTQYRYLFLLGIFFFSFCRLLILLLRFEKLDRVISYFLNYIHASTQMVVFSRIQSQWTKIFLIAVTMSVRYILIYQAEPTAFDAFSCVKYIASDIFVTYLFFSNEKTERRVFRSYYENHDELVKFKELLADSLPQSVIVVDAKTQKRLFANNNFLDSFDSAEEKENQTTVTMFSENSQQVKPQWELLKMDPSTIREVCGNHQEEHKTSTQFVEISCLKDLLEKLVKENWLTEKALSINSSYMGKEKHRTYQVILKRIKWERVDAVAVILNDTTYQENLMALKLANNNKDQIIATVSHELRTPLHGIIGLLEIVETRVSDQEVLSHLSLCKDNAHLLSSLVNSLLDLQQLSTGKLNLNKVKIDVVKTLKDVAQLFKFQCDKKNISLEVEVGEDVQKSIVTDENRLKQVLINLIGNAIKFTFKGGIKIEVRQSQQEEDCLVFSVSDTGIGIKEEDMGKLFKMYGKLADNCGLNKNGVGLGLMISSTLAALLNGKMNAKGLEVISKYGEGSKFFFEVLKDLQDPDELANPRKSVQKGVKQESQQMNIETYNKNENSSTESRENIADDNSEDLVNLAPAFKVSNCLDRFPEVQVQGRLKSTEAAKEEKKPRKSDLQKANGCILVVDDNPFNILVALSLLKDIGHEIKSASGGQEAIGIVQQCVQEGRPMKMIFLDCQMPVMDGFETARVLRRMMENGEVPSVPIFGWTANNSEQDIKRCYENGMEGYLSKPTTKENITKLIQQQR